VEGSLLSSWEKEYNMNRLFYFLARNERALFVVLFLIAAILSIVLPAVVIPKLNPLMDFVPG